MSEYRKAINLDKPSNQEAVKKANSAIAPETGGRQLTMGPEDADSRKKWMDAYIAAGGEYKVVKPSGKKVKDPKANCPKKLIKVVWSHHEAYCGNPVALLGTAQNMDPDTPATAEVTAEGKGHIITLNGKGQNTFNLPWEVKDVVFEGPGMPEQYNLKGKLSAAGQTAETKKLLEVHRVPDKVPDPVRFSRTSAEFVDFDPSKDGGKSGRVTVKKDGATWKYWDTATSAWTTLPRAIANYTKNSYGWDAKFKMGVDKDKLKVTLTLQIKTAWLGKWVRFDPAAPPAGDGKAGRAFVKKDGVDWKYWNTAPKAWTALPRNIASYKVNDIVFIKKEGKFVGRTDASQKWPEAFLDPPSNLNKMKTDWLDNLHNVWDNKFNLHRKNCKSSSDKCCTWRIRVKANWSENAGDKLVYAVWAQDYEGSDAQDWYLSDPGVETGGHEGGHLLGAYDEYNGGALDKATYKIEDDSIMGINLTKAYARHFDGLRDQAKKKINGWIKRNWDFEVKDA
jgi:hypothetical protein